MPPNAACEIAAQPGAPAVMPALLLGGRSPEGRSVAAEPPRTSVPSSTALQRSRLVLLPLQVSTVARAVRASKNKRECMQQGISLSLFVSWGPARARVPCRPERAQSACACVVAVP